MNNELKEKWKKDFDESIKSIENYLDNKNSYFKEEEDFKVLANWLVSNQYYDCDFLPQGYQNIKSSPYALESFLQTLHHSLCDDGDISFVIMKEKDEIKRVFLMFVWQNEDIFRDLCLKENKEMIEGLIDSRNMLNNVTNKLLEKFPEKKNQLKIKDNIEFEDIIFEAHKDPIRFIKDVEEVQEKMRKTRELNEKWLRKNKII